MITNYCREIITWVYFEIFGTININFVVDGSFNSVPDKTCSFFIDFEFAANNDPVYDIGTFGNGDALEGKRLLEEYEKLVPLKDGLKRYALWRIDISLQWYLVAVIKHYRGEGKIHGIDFLAVGKHFLGVAEEAYKLIK